jgi:stalled ribosome rescue protein Dom34
MTVGLFTHLSKDGTKLGKRHTFEIVPAISLTVQTEENAYLLKIINAAFGKNEFIRIVNVNTGGKGIRLVIKNAKILKQWVVPFFVTYEPSIQKNRIRLKTFCNILQELPLDYQNKERIIERVREIYDTDLYERDKSLEDFLNIVELDYN